jgi:hypothetical protein
MERNPIIEAVVRFRENAEPRFDGFFCNGSGGAAVAIWLGERKSENECGICGACRVLCSAGVKTGRGLPASGELRKFPIRASVSQSYIISASQRTDHILLPDFVVVRSKAVSH